VHKYESALRFTIRTSVGDSFPAPHSRTLPPQRPSTVPIDRPGLISQRRIRPARTPRMLALSPLPAPLIILKTKRAGRIPVSAPRARRRDPVVFTPAMLALAADRHTSRLYQNSPHPATAVVAPAANQNRRTRARPTLRPATAATTKRPFTAQRRAQTTFPLSKSVSRPASDPHAPRLRFPVRASAPTFFDFREP
jgi:hypothetical protein